MKNKDILMKNPDYKNIQKRVLEGEELQFRAVEENDKRFIEGYAALFNSRSKLLAGSFYEVIERGAFDDVLRSDSLNVVAVFNHDDSKILGRNTSGTLELRSDEKGLWYRVEVPDTPTGNEVYSLIKRGDLFQNSFRFRVAEDGWKEEGMKDEDGETRSLITITKVSDLRDVSVVTWPAYEETSVYARKDEEEKEKGSEEAEEKSLTIYKSKTYKNKLKLLKLKNNI